MLAKVKDLVRLLRRIAVTVAGTVILAVGVVLLVAPGPVYERGASRGRMLPEGLRYIDSWVIDNGRLDRCFQLMETDSPELLDAWRARWADLVDFDIIPVITSSEAAQRSGARQSPPPGTGGRHPGPAGVTRSS